MLSDTRKLVFYYRLSQDRRRMLFGGRVALRRPIPGQSAPQAPRPWMTRIFPELAPVKITHSWMGFVAYTFDTLPHIGRQDDGIYYCMGYCGSGVSLASYFGTPLGQQVLGRPRAARPWTTSPSRRGPSTTATPGSWRRRSLYYQLRDKLNL